MAASAHAFPHEVVLVTGGAGYIGSHTVVELLAAGEDVVVVDNLLNAAEEALRRVEEIAHKVAGRFRALISPFQQKLAGFHHVDITDPVALDKIFSMYRIKGMQESNPRVCLLMPSCSCDPLCCTESRWSVRFSTASVLPQQRVWCVHVVSLCLPNTYLAIKARSCCCKP